MLISGPGGTPPCTGESSFSMHFGEGNPAACFTALGVREKTGTFTVLDIRVAAGQTIIRRVLAADHRLPTARAGLCRGSVSLGGSDRTKLRPRRPIACSASLIRMECRLAKVLQSHQMHSDGGAELASYYAVATYRRKVSLLGRFPAAPLTAQHGWKKLALP